MSPDRDADYILGTGAAEQERLRAQGDAVGPMTERLLAQAGVGKGMRVLDLGCGAGDVAILLARLVGSSGAVLGVDRELAMLSKARERVAELGLTQVSFVQGDFRQLGAEVGTFDAAFGRLVLMYQADPVEAIKAVSSRVRPGGIIVFQEYDSTIPPTSLVRLPLHVQVRDWIWETLRRSGVDAQVGFKLYSLFMEAGLPAPEVRAEAMVQTPTTRYPTVPLVRSLLPKMVAYRIANEAEVDVDTLEQRLLAERRTANTAYVGQVAFGAWARRPA